jgi:HSP20 family protein
MENIPSHFLRRIEGCLGEMAYELRIQYLSVAREQSWTPAINAYHCGSQIVVCVELAGVDRERIELHAEPRRLVVRGARAPIETLLTEAPPLHVFALEIDQGVFHREIALPLAIDPDAVRAKQRNGLLWIFLPLVS